MSTAWRVVDLTGTSQPIEVRRGRIAVAGSSIGLDDCACILTGPSTTWSGDLLAQAAQHDVILVACDWRGVPIAATLPWSTNTRIATRQLAQARLSVPRQKNAWKRIVQAKIRGQASNIETNDAPAAKHLRDLARQVRSGDPTNIEARAARTYWSKYLPGHRFTRRRDQTDHNALLNYGYAVARAFTVRAICLTGLTPTLGIWHHHRANPFSLADDILEPFRPAIDHTARTQPDDATLEDPTVKAAMVAAVHQPMALRGRTVATAITDLAQAFAHYVEGDQSVLDVPTWTAPGG